MPLRKDVFISSTSADLGSYRQVVKDALLSLGAYPIEQTNFPTDYREMEEVLARRLDRCDAIIHLAGFHYGGEPRPAPGIPRRSWTQWEYHRAMEGDKPKPVYRFLARVDCAFDAQLQEDAEKRRLQREHYEHLRKPGGPIYYEFSSHDELRERILRINELRQLLGLRLARLPFLPMRENFTGRRPVLATVEAELTTGYCGVLSQPSAVHADGGVGKTALAVELGWRLFEKEKFDWSVDGQGETSFQNLRIPFEFLGKNLW